MLKQCLLLSALGLIAVSALAQNPGDPANIANVPNIMDSQNCPRVPTSARGSCTKFSPEWYQYGFDPAKRTKELSKQLKLTADQQSQMLDTLESTKSQLEAVRSDRSLSRSARDYKLALIRRTSNCQINAFLDKKQNAKFVRIQSYAYNVDRSPANWGP
jgi:hypothetical protein